MNSDNKNKSTKRCCWNRQPQFRYVFYATIQRATSIQKYVLRYFVSRYDHCKYQTVRRGALYVTVQDGHFEHLMWKDCILHREFKSAGNNRIILGPLAVVSGKWIVFIFINVWGGSNEERKQTSFYDTFSLFWSIQHVSEKWPPLSETRCVIFQLVKLPQLVKKGQDTYESSSFHVEFRRTIHWNFSYINPARILTKHFIKTRLYFNIIPKSTFKNAIWFLTLGVSTRILYILPISSVSNMSLQVSSYYSKYIFSWAPYFQTCCVYVL